MEKPRFQIVEVIGAGRWGVVCVALDSKDTRPVALKVMLEDLASEKRSIARFRDEARILRRLRHPNLVEVREAVDIAGRPVLVMEWVDGCNLEEVIRQHPGGIPVDVAIAIVRPIALGLNAAWHGAMNERPMHVLHRDLKPANVLMSVEGVVKVVDFGLAKGEFSEREAQSLQGELVLGSRAYTSPERMDGESGPTVDVYSLGLMLLELLTGVRRPLSVRPAVYRTALEAWITDANAPTGVSGLVRDMTNFVSEGRPSMAEVIRRLDVVLADDHRDLLLDFTATTIQPLRATRTVVAPEDHPAWGQLAKIGVPLGAGARRLERAVTPDAVARHLDTLNRATRAWWDLWSRQSSQESVILSISALAGTEDVVARDRLRALALHPDAMIAAAARGAIGGDKG